MFSLNAAGYGEIISSGQGGVFLRLLFIWKGSLYKLVWRDLAVYLGLYYFINFIYRFALNSQQRENFEEVVKFCDSMKQNIPISFLLGFFVTGVIARWCQMYMCIPWLNRIAFMSQGAIIGGSPEIARQVRVSLLRYMNLAWILLMRNISEQIANRFRTYQNKGAEEKSVSEILCNINKDEKVQLHFRKLITEQEICAMECISANYYSTYRKKYIPEYWIPLQWSVRLLIKAFSHGYIPDLRTLMSLIKEVDELRNEMANLIIYSGVMIPLVYSQVVIIALYCHFLLHLFAAQFVDPAKKMVGHEVDFYVPVFTIIQFLFLMGWLKVAMCVLNPFGDDDEDFQTSDMLDYNLEVSQRSAAAEMTIYPAHCQLPNLQFRSQTNADQDNFYEFMADIAEELDEVKPGDLIFNNMSTFEVVEPFHKRCLNIITCKKQNKKTRCLSDTVPDVGVSANESSEYSSRNRLDSENGEYGRFYDNVKRDLYQSRELI